MTALPIGSAPLAAAGTSVLRAESSLVGTISGGTDLLVEGQLEGEIRVESSVTVAAAGRIKATIQARSVTVAGTVIGNIVATDRVEIQASGSVHGDIAAPRLVIADGATLSGSVQIKRAATAASPPVSPPVNLPKQG